MSDPKRDLEMVTSDPSGWCDPDTGVCIIETGEDEPVDEHADDNSG